MFASSRQAPNPVQQQPPQQLPYQQQYQQTPFFNQQPPQQGVSFPQGGFQQATPQYFQPPQQQWGQGNVGQSLPLAPEEDFFAMRGTMTTTQAPQTQPQASPPPKPVDKFAHLVNLDNMMMGSQPGFKPSSNPPPMSMNAMAAQRK